MSTLTTNLTTEKRLTQIGTEHLVSPDLADEVLEPDVPSKIQVSVSGMPTISRIAENPVAIAVRYTNHNDTDRTELLVSFDVHIVDNHTPEKLVFPQRHLKTGHCAVCVQCFTTMGVYVGFKESFLEDCPDTIWVEN